jgi:hypothetical protein
MLLDLVYIWTRSIMTPCIRVRSERTATNVAFLLNWTAEEELGKSLGGNEGVIWGTGSTRWFKYDQDKLWLVFTQIVPVIFEPPCTNAVFLYLGTRWRWMVASCPGRFTLGQMFTGTYWAEIWVGPKVGLLSFEQTGISFLCRESKQMPRFHKESTSWQPHAVNSAKMY